MQQRFAICSGLVVFILAALCTPTQQRPPCPSPVDYGENALGVEEHHHYGPSTKFISRIENLAAVKELMEKLLMQHNALADGNVSGAEEGSSSSETPSSFSPLSTSIEVEENSTERPLTSSALKEENSATERPPADVFDVDQLKMAAESGHSSEHSSTTKKSNDEELFSEQTTVEPQHNYPNEVTTTQPPNSIIVDKSGVQLAAPTQAPVSSTQKKNTTSYPVNLPPPSPISNRNNTKRTTTQRPQVIVHPQQLNTPNHTPFTENPEKIKLRPTTKPRISTLKPVHLGHDVKDDVQLETLNRPIIRRKPTTPPVGSATSNRPKKKPINITPQSVVVKKRPKPVGKPQGSPGIRNPIRNSSSPPREPEDYIISALASIADGGDENTDGDDGDEDDEYEEENSNENEGEEENEDEDEDEYLYNSEEEIEERENLVSVDASGVISSVMKEVGALL